MITQAEVSRAIKGALKGCADAGLKVERVTARIENGAISVEVTTAPASPTPSIMEGSNVETLAERIRNRAPRRP